MHEHALFAGNVMAHLVASMSGLVSFALSVVQAIRKKEIATWIFFAIGCLCLLIAFDQAWRDEHRNLETVIQSKAEAWGQYNTCDKERAINTVLAQTYANQIAQQTVSLHNQQDVFNRCLLTLTTTTIPERQRTTVKQIQPLTMGNVGGKFMKVWFLLAFTNRIVTPVRGKLTCAEKFLGGGFESAAEDSGSEVLGYHAKQVNEKETEFGLQSPVWTPQAPLVFVMTTEGQDSRLGACSIQLD